MYAESLFARFVNIVEIGLLFGAVAVFFLIVALAVTMMHKSAYRTYEKTSRSKRVDAWAAANKMPRAVAERNVKRF